LRNASRKIDYTNFKDSVANIDRDRAYPRCIARDALAAELAASAQRRRCLMMRLDLNARRTVASVGARAASIERGLHRRRQPRHTDRKLHQRGGNCGGLVL
jgi:hypothetical protein